jgi:hypothetical protein
MCVCAPYRPYPLVGVPASSKGFQMESSTRNASVARLDEVEPIDVAGGRFQPLRRILGVRAFGINAYTASCAGDQLIEQHDETGAGSGGHEEAYIVVSGHASFTIGDRQIDAPAGTIVFVPDIGTRRAAVALSDQTTAIVVGAPADQQLPVSPFEYWFVAEAPYKHGDYQTAIKIVSEGLEQWPDHPDLHYQLACYHALAEDTDQALNHLELAVAADDSARELAASDTDFSTIHTHPRFTELTSPRPQDNAQKQGRRAR